MLTFTSPKPVKFTFTFKEKYDLSISKKIIPLSDVSSLFYDLILLNDCIVLASIEDYENFNFSNNFFYRNGRPVHPDHILYVHAINHNSPLNLELIIPLTAAGLGIPWLLLQAIEKIRNWNLNHEKLRLEVENLRQNNLSKSIENQNRMLDLEERLSNRNAKNVFDGIQKRLDKSKLTATDLEIDFFDE